MLDLQSGWEGSVFMNEFQFQVPRSLCKLLHNTNSSSSVIPRLTFRGRGIQVQVNGFCFGNERMVKISLRGSRRDTFTCASFHLACL